MTQWIFHPDVCSCGVENQDFLAAVQAATGSQPGGPAGATTNNTVPLSTQGAFIYELENGEIDYHGLSADSFPFERFRIIEEVGRGAAGIVYQAWDCFLKRRVAIKTMHSALISSEEVIRLQNEARTSSRLKHPAIIRILDFGAAPNGQPYLVSDFIDGTTLKSRIDENGPLSMAETVQMFKQLCAGIMHAHEQNVLHRDLKSSNVIISDDTGDGTNIKIIDFGVARFKEALFQTFTIVQTATIVGTPYYMSPEQGDGKTFDARSEIYSIGCMMFEALTGQVPFQGETALETLAMHTRESVPELDEINPDVDCSEQLELIVLRCLEKDPDDRFQSVSDLYEQLNACSTQAISAVPEVEQPDPPQDDKQQQRMGKNISVAVIALILCLAAMTWGVLVLTESKDSETAEAEKAREKRSKKQKISSENNIAQPLEMRNSDAIDQIPLFTQKNPWNNPSSGNWVASAWVKDEDFAALKDEKFFAWLESPLSLEVTGAGLKYVKDKPVRSLHLNSKNLSDVALDNIGEMKSLQWLSLGNAHKLSQSKFQVLTKLPSLTALKLQDVVSTPALIELVADCQKLTGLVLMDKPPGSGKTNWAPLTRLGRLTAFSLLKYDFTDADVKYIRSLSKLKELRLSDLGLSDFDANKIIVAPVTILDLSCNNITDKTVEKLGSIKTLKELDLTGCPGVTANGIKNLQSKLKNCNILRRADNKPNRDEWSVGRIGARRTEQKKEH